MNPRACGLEHDVAVAGCPACREAAAVADYLSALARRHDQDPLPDAAELHRRARIVERLFHDPPPLERAMRRLALAELLAVGLSAMALGAWLLRAGTQPVLQQPLSALLAAAFASPQTIAMALGAAALAAALPLLLAWPLLAEE